MSGNMTRTTTFYGVCFDYAQFAYDDIKKYKSWYNEQGLYGSSWYIAIAGASGNSIEIYDPCTREQADIVSNGVYLKRNTIFNTKTHKKSDGSRATQHAWIQIKRDDGVWFWIDPTWTDNLGYVVYGYVKNGEEVQLRPDEKYCINYPDYLKQLPSSPARGKKISSSSSSPSYSSRPSSSSRSTSSSTSNKSGNSIGGYFCVGYMGSFESVSSEDSSFINFNKFGFELSSESTAELSNLFAILSFDYIVDNSDGTDENKKSSWLLGLSWGYSALPFFEPYVGSSLGMKWTDSFSWDNIGFAWKVSGGIRIPLSDFVIRGDVSYGTILGLAGTVAVGLKL